MARIVFVLAVLLALAGVVDTGGTARTGAGSTTVGATGSAAGSPSPPPHPNV